MPIDLSAFSEKAPELRVLNLRASKHGRLVASHDWDEDCRRNIYSASKSFTAIAVGIAQQEGLLSIDERLTDAFAEDLPESVSEHLLQARVRDLLTMCLGQAQGFLMGAQRPLYPETDWVKLALRQPFPYAPGTRFVYNNVGPYLAGVLVQRRAGMDLVSYLMPRLFGPLGIHRPTWECDPLGQTFGAGGLMLTASELHRFGLLCQQDGHWQGQQLVPAQWVQACLQRQAENGTPHGYGYLFWGGADQVFRADGKYGQLCFIDRRGGAVLTLLAECRDTKALMEAVREDLLPQL